MPLTKYSSIQFINQTFNDKVNLIDILSHRMGLPRNDLALLVNVSATDYIQDAIDTQPIDSFGNSFHYNNPMFALAGVLASNGDFNKSMKGDIYQKWRAMMNEHIFKPLNMTSASVDLNVSLLKPFLFKGNTGR
jgi:CubicO group peptidase (beta-lactamase class C family)